MFSPQLVERAARLLAQCRRQKLTIATAESCTGGLVAGLLTEIAGSSDVVLCGLVTYANSAKQQLLGVKAETLATLGAVSAACAVEMVQGVQRISGATLAVAITGIAGPGGGTAEKPVGLVHFAVVKAGLQLRPVRCVFVDEGRTAIRLAAVAQALELLESCVG